MPRKLTQRQWWILHYLAEHPGATLQQIADASPVNETATEEWRAEHPNSTASYTVRSIEYPTAQASMTRLLDAGLVRRDPVDREPAGPPYHHFLVKLPDTEDALEQAFRAPSATLDSTFGEGGVK